jgi:hypothetical protein
VNTTFGVSISFLANACHDKVTSLYCSQLLNRLWMWEFDDRKFLYPYILLLININILLNLLNPRTVCPICKIKLVEHSEFQDKICKMVTIKQFANNSPGFDVAFRPFVEDE